MSAAAGAQVCSVPGCDQPAAFRTRTKPSWCAEHLDDKLAEKRLIPAEPFQHPRTYWLVHCQVCEYETHLLLDYILGAPVPCSVCRWRRWERNIYETAPALGMRPLEALEANVRRLSDAAAAAHAEANGFTYLERVPNLEVPLSDLHLVQCRTCGRRLAMRSGDIGWGCTCRVNPRRSDQADPASRKAGRKRLLRDEHPEVAGRLWDAEANDPSLWDRLTFRARTEVSWRCPECGHRWQASPVHLGRGGWQCPECERRRRAEGRERYEAYKRTPVADVPELMAMWDDPRDASTVMVGGGGPYSAQFRCPQGHPIRTAPYSLLQSGCPHCRGLETRARRAQAAQEAPEETLLDRELVSQWHPTRNARTPAQVGPGSTVEVWWRDPVCGHEWQESPKSRGQRFRLRCPECESVLDSLAWHYPELAEEWAPDNPVSPWHVRPAGRIAFVPWWVCKLDPAHRWQATTVSRTNGGACPGCVGAGKSAVELAFHAAAERVFGEARSGSVVYSEAFMRRKRWTADIVVDSPVPGLRGVVIEYDGAYWHRDKLDVDLDKSVDLMAADYAVVRLREVPLEALPLASPRYLGVSVHGVSDPDAVMSHVAAWTRSLTP